MNRRALGICVVLAALLGVAWWVRSGASKKSVATEREGVVVASTSNGATAMARASAITSARVIAPAKTWSAKWGSGRGELGRDRPSEGNPEGPMSFVASGKDLLVVDQVNQRLVRFDKDGKVKGTQAIGPTVQDVAVGKDGTVALLDRLGDKNVTVTDSNGKRIGTLPLGTGDPGNITGVFVDGNTVYVEEGHGGLTSVGTTDGQPMQSPVTLGGRPTKDGALLVTGTLAPAEGKLTVNAIDRTSGTLRFARLIQMPRPSSFIVLLDSDDRGVVYAGVAAGDQATVACLDPNDGHVLGRIVMPMNGDPDETFRDFSVDGDGTILHAVRDDTGVTYATATCP